MSAVFWQTGPGWPRVRGAWGPSKFEPVWAPGQAGRLPLLALHKRLAGECADMALQAGCGVPEPADELLEHILLVRERSSPLVVGALCIRSPVQVRAAGGLRTARAFDLDRLHALRDGLAEIDRVVLDPDQPASPILCAMWSALARYMADAQLRHAVCCIEMPTHDGGHYAASVYRTLARRRMVAPGLRAVPRRRLATESLLSGCDPVLPPLVKAALAAGAAVLGEPHVDDARTASLPMLWQPGRQRWLPSGILPGHRRIADRVG